MAFDVKNIQDCGQLVESYIAPDDNTPSICCIAFLDMSKKLPIYPKTFIRYTAGCLLHCTLRQAGLAYFKAADFAATYKKEYTEIIDNFERSARCFLKIKNIRAFSCIDNIIAIYQNNKAIERCVVYGYKCEINFTDGKKSSELYHKADELRLKHNIAHTCSRTKFDLRLYEHNINKKHEYLPKGSSYTISRQMYYTAHLKGPFFMPDHYSYIKRSIRVNMNCDFSTNK
ncbi:hypothetical protein RF11_10448 [Thelohanellus kitauei]|uniref:Uncharacterized protein n=1 Tax=Thelohanellus kitauei TaxID=669202 RepID=A0A0C2JBC2_THEKT|nr:hypothetical protein RF11_10448 [Thelohanellus kitauei]